MQVERCFLFYSLSLFDRNTIFFIVLWPITSENFMSKEVILTKITASFQNLFRLLLRLVTQPPLPWNWGFHKPRSYIKKKCFNIFPNLDNEHLKLFFADIYFHQGFYQNGNIQNMSITLIPFKATQLIP